MADIDAKTWLETVIIDDANLTADSHTDVVSQHSVKAYADQVLVDAKDYTDAEISALDFATTDYVDTGDSNTLSSAESYADAAVSAYGPSGALAAALLAQHDIVMNSTVGVQLQTSQYEFTAIVPSVTGTGSLTAPDWVKYTDNGGGSNGLWTLAFSPTSMEEVLGTATFSLKRPIGTSITPFVYWSGPSTGSGDQRVVWGIEYFWPTKSGTITASTVITSFVRTPTTSPVTAGQIYLTELPALSPPSNELSAIYCRIFRDAASANDTYADDALLGGIAFFYPVTRIGAPASEL